MNEQNIADFIVKTVSMQPSILGSQLGAVVKRAFPWFHGLKAYIDRYCANQVVCVGKRGPDYIYAHVSTVGTGGQGDSAENGSIEVHQVPKTAPDILQTQKHIVAYGPTARPSTFWTAFTNPNLRDRLALDPCSREFHIVREGSTVQPPLVEVSKVTTDEHRTIAFRFLSKLDEDDRSYFQQIANQPNSCPALSWRITSFADGKYKDAWLNFRTQSLRGLLDERLAKLGIDNPPDREPLLAKLMESKHYRARQAGPFAALERSFENRARTNPGHSITSEQDLRRFAIAAISEMGADQLAQVWLPLSAIVNGLKRNDPQ